ncbi:VUT family protein [Silvanigrella sp.]|jgi:uncharacterized PurR-regulated membrane protein YhhQ (DUF165 family)|uniref:VUT family protein n=1 Tax=Silvanigrella sp. TaxID=2024976 RepID=UPI0037C88013
MAVKFIKQEDIFTQKPTLMMYSYLMSFLVLIQLICDVVALLTINISSIHLSASGVIFPIAFVLVGIIANIYGAERAKSVAIAMTMAQFIFCITVFIFASVKTNNTFNDNGVSQNFSAYFIKYWSVTSAGILDTFIPLWICSVLTSKCKKLFVCKTSKNAGVFYNFPIIGYFLSIFIPLCLSQLSLVLITYTINFGLGVGVSLSDLFNIITSTYIYKLCIGLLIALFLTRPLTKLCTYFDKIDTYDYGVSYNIFPKKGNTGVNVYVNKICQN